MSSSGKKRLFTTHDSQHGFRQGHSCDDVFYDIALSMEEALLSGNSLIGVHFDYKKAFDLVPRNIIFNLASRLGFSSKLIDVMKSFIPPFSDSSNFLVGIANLSSLLAEFCKAAH
jgi:hypothetical protein